MSVLDRMIMAAVRCVKCNAKYGHCDCWSKCPCGWSYAKGEQCRNPIHGGEGDIGIVAMTPRRRRKKRNASAGSNGPPNKEDASDP